MFGVIDIVLLNYWHIIGLHVVREYSYDQSMSSLFRIRQVSLLCVSLSSMLRDCGDSCLVPIADMLNHSSSVEVVL